MSLSNIVEVEIFDIWGIDIMGPFLDYNGNQYILVVVFMCLSGLRMLLYLLMM